MGIGNAISNLGSDVSSGVQSFFGASPETAGTVTDALGGAAAGAGLGVTFALLESHPTVETRIQVYPSPVPAPFGASVEFPPPATWHTHGCAL